MSEKRAGVVFAEERQNRILQMLLQDRKLMVNELSHHFRVSPTTIRNDLNLLSKKGLLQRTHGGAVAISRVNFELSSNEKATRHLAEKKRIAQKACAMVEDSDTIVLDTGSTTAIMAAALKAANLTVVTNDLNIALSLEQHKDYRIVFLGGTLRKEYHCTLGATTVKEMRKYHVDKAFIATNSISISSGLSTPDINHADIKKCMIESAEEVILLATSNKFGLNSFVHFADVEAMDHIVTDGALDDETVRILTDKGIEVITV